MFCPKEYACTRGPETETFHFPWWKLLWGSSCDFVSDKIFGVTKRLAYLYCVPVLIQREAVVIHMKDIGEHV